jgi:hypothetical protein
LRLSATLLDGGFLQFDGIVLLKLQFAMPALDDGVPRPATLELLANQRPIVGPVLADNSS